MIITLTMNPAIDKTGFIQEFHIKKLNRLDNIILTSEGKGLNVSKTLSNLSCKSKCITFLPGENGQFIQRELNDFGIELYPIKVNGGLRTNTKIVTADSLTEINEPGFKVDNKILDNLIKILNQEIEEGDLLVISGSVPEGTPTSYYKGLILKMKEKRVTTLLDADGELFKEGVKALPTIIKPNVFELCQYYQMEETYDEEVIVEYARKWIHDGVEQVIVSMGENGSIYVTKDTAMKAEPLSVEVASTVGAGDALVAALAYAYEHKYELEEMIRLCAATSSAAVTTKGTIAPEFEMIESLMKQVKIGEI
ncbi:1-phosphofructokinase [Breznakia pachnodae]|uniref:Tagatose-6-phosphate kinase n=1 Tax=Breznakia pachnodae TaxID=265178 RepID=A0ABU0E198_9FIRM|nr:1-phosphofructokinase [Breznakia pachnodae]MDQ0360501.1 1-phosphofructokinase [Breznakia pachnodae]